jgi:hypothetical protein
VKVVRCRGVGWHGAEIGVARTVGRTLAYSGAPRVRMIWIVRTGESVPRFVTCWVL